MASLISEGFEESSQNQTQGSFVFVIGSNKLLSYQNLFNIMREENDKYESEYHFDLS